MNSAYINPDYRQSVSVLARTDDSHGKLSLQAVLIMSHTNFGLDVNLRFYRIRLVASKIKDSN
jgi:hypothetical protein